MDGFIDENGRLYIKRGSRYKMQRCMYNADEPCCDLCPSFQEPNYENENEYNFLSICHSDIIFNKLEDRRS